MQPGLVEKPAWTGWLWKATSRKSCFSSMTLPVSMASQNKIVPSAACLWRRLISSDFLELLLPLDFILPCRPQIICNTEAQDICYSQVYAFSQN